MNTSTSFLSGWQWFNYRRERTLLYLIYARPSDYCGFGRLRASTWIKNRFPYIRQMNVVGNLLSVRVRTHRKTVHDPAFPTECRCFDSGKWKYLILYVPNHNQHDAEPQIPVKSPLGSRLQRAAVDHFGLLHQLCEVTWSNINGSSDWQQQQTCWGWGDRCLQQGRKPPGSGVFRKTCEPPGINVIDFIQTA